MKRIIYILILIFFLSGSIILMWPTTKTTHTYRSSDLEKVENGNVTEYRLNGVLTYAANLHYAKKVLTETKEDGNSVIIEAYFDEYGKPAKQTDGHYALQKNYNNGLNTSIIYLDMNLQPMINTNGYTMKMMEYENDAVVAEWYEDMDGYPVVNNQGVYGRKYDYENGRSTVLTFVDFGGQPLNQYDGYAIVRRSFYEKGPNIGRINTELYYDSVGSPVSLAIGQYGVHKEYDEFGRAVRIDYLDQDGMIISSAIRSFYPDDTIETEKYYNAAGEPMARSAGNYGIKKVDGKSIYLNAEGKEYQSFNRYLHNEPLMVMLIGVVLVLLSSIGSRRANCILIALYLLFVLYMTFWNRDGDNRVEIELFWSYKQFFLSQLLKPLSFAQ